MIIWTVRMIENEHTTGYSYVLVKWWNVKKNSEWNFIIFLPGKWNHPSSFEDWIGFLLVFFYFIQLLWTILIFRFPWHSASRIQHSVFTQFQSYELISGIFICIAMRIYRFFFNTTLENFYSLPFCCLRLHTEFNSPTK